MGKVIVNLGGALLYQQFPQHFFLVFHYNDLKSKTIGSFCVEYQRDSKVEISFDYAIF